MIEVNQPEGLGLASAVDESLGRTDEDSNEPSEEACVMFIVKNGERQNFCRWLLRGDLSASYARIITQSG